MTAAVAPAARPPRAVNLADFQQRLSARLQAAQSGAGPAPAAWLAVQAHGRDCLLPLAQCGAFHAWRAPEPVPHSPPWMHGIVALQGGLVAVADLGAVLQGGGAGAAAGGTPGLLTPPPAWGLSLAWRADRVVGLRGPADFVASRPPAATAAPYWRMGQRDAQGRWWSVLDLAALLRSGFLQAVGTPPSWPG